MEFIDDKTQDHIDGALKSAKEGAYEPYQASKAGSGTGYEAYRAGYTAGAAAPPSGPPKPLGPHSKVVDGKAMLGIGQAREDFDNDYNVKYIEDEKRSKYLVELGAQMRRRGSVFDTAEVVKHFKGKDRSGRNKKGEVRAQIQGMSEPTMASDQTEEWSDSALIWVWSSEGKFYSHVPKVFRFHHSSFVAGGDVQGAGQWIVKDGKLAKINPLSGHYMPTMSHLHKSVLAMAAAWQKDTTVFLWDAAGKKWVDIPVANFGDEPGGGGKYKVHPDAP